MLVGRGETNTQVSGGQVLKGVSAVYDFKTFCLVAKSGYHGKQSGSPSASPGGQHCNSHINLKKVLNFLVAKSGYKQP